MKLSVVCGKKPASKEVQITNVTKEEMKEDFYECICYDGKLYHETYAGTTVEPEEYIGSVEETVEAGKIPAKNLYENQELYTTDPFRDVLGYEVFVDKDNEHRIYLDVEGYFYLYDFVETE